MPRSTPRQFPPLSIAGALFALTNLAHAALDTDPFVYDPQFDQGAVFGDRFADSTGVTIANGLRVLVAAHYNGDDNGDIVAIGNVMAHQGHGNGNLGAVRYDSSGNRVAWGNPTAQYSFGGGEYVDYPNTSNNYISAVDDAKLFEGFIFALVDVNRGTQRDVRIVSILDGGMGTSGGPIVNDLGAFTTSLDETGVALVPYTYSTFDGDGNPITAYRMIAVANYTTSGGRRIITMKRFIVDISTSFLTVDNSFGISNNGAMDQMAPNSMCHANANCSWDVSAVAALRTNTNNPTLYLGGTAYDRTSNPHNDGVVVSVNGYDGSLNPHFGMLGAAGIFVNELTDPSGITAIVATPSGAGDAANDRVYVASTGGAYNPSCTVNAASVTKLLAQAPITGLPGLLLTLRDGSFANDGVLQFGGDPIACIYSTLPADMLLDGNRLAIVGAEQDTSGTLHIAKPDLPLLAIVRASDGVLTEYRRGALSGPYTGAIQAKGSVFNSIALRSPGRYAVTGSISDAGGLTATLFGTAELAADRIFGDGFD